LEEFTFINHQWLYKELAKLSYTNILKMFAFHVSCAGVFVLVFFYEYKLTWIAFIHPAFIPKAARLLLGFGNELLV